MEVVLGGVARSVEAVFGLPAVPTLDWCDRAAGAVARLIEPAVAVVTIGTVGESGELLQQEASGVAVRQPMSPDGRARPLARDEIGTRGEDGRVGALRVRAARLRALGLRLTAEDRTRMIAGPLAALPGGEAVAEGDLSELWSNLETSAPIVGLVPLCSEGAEGRMMIVQVASVAPAGPPVEGVSQGLAAVLPGLRHRTLQALGSERAESTRWLTEREQLVLEHLSLGKSVRQIADDLGRSPHTVHDHVKSLHRKLGASSRGELIARALGHGIERGVDAGPITMLAASVEAKPSPRPAESGGAIEPKPTPGVANPMRFDSEVG